MICALKYIAHIVQAKSYYRRLLRQPFQKSPTTSRALMSLGGTGLPFS